MNTHAFRLRRDVTVSIELPDDFNARDVARLTAWLATLPLDQPAIELPASPEPIAPQLEHGRQCGHDCRRCPDTADHLVWVEWTRRYGSNAAPVGGRGDA